jgi:hypothetical protein
MQSKIERLFSCEFGSSRRGECDWSKEACSHPIAAESVAELAERFGNRLNVFGVLIVPPLFGLITHALDAWFRRAPSQA